MLSVSRLQNYLLMLDDFLSCEFPALVAVVGFFLGYFQIFSYSLYSFSAAHFYFSKR